MIRARHELIERIGSEAERRYGSAGWRTVTVVWVLEDGNSEVVRVKNPRLAGGSGAREAAATGGPADVSSPL